MAAIATKRIYAPAAEDDGRRVLVDRVWPRGVSKARAALDDWAKAAAPSGALRRWFGHRAERWPEFLARYRAELRDDAAAAAAFDGLRAAARRGRLTLLYSAHDEAHNQAVALKRFLEEAEAQERG